MTDEGTYTIEITIQGNRHSAHFLAKSIEQQCDLAIQCLDLQVARKVVLEK